MITVHFTDGLGNQMFQYAIARHLAKRTFARVFADLYYYKGAARQFELDKLNVKIHLFKPRSIRYRALKRFFKPVNYRVDADVPLNIDVFNIKNRNVHIWSFWINYLYFNDIRNILLKEFQPRKKFIDTENKKLVKEMQTCNSVSIHIRRGDYSTHELLYILNDEYYDNAVKYISQHIENPQFYVFSDDIEYANEKYCDKNFKIININRGSNSFLDLYLMSNCKHNIIANSTFSWWAAYLNQNKNKIVIRPQRWMKSDEQNFAIMPNDWI